MPWKLMIAVALLTVGACKQQPPPSDEPSRTPPRTDFAPEEFGIGRAHTKNTRCNRQIDRLLEQVRSCYNTPPTADCDTLSRTNADKIARLKNSAHCRH